MQILLKEPGRRLSLIGVREHEWIEKNRNLEKKLLPCFDQFAHLEEKLTKKYREAGEWLKKKREESKPNIVPPTIQQQPSTSSTTNKGGPLKPTLSTMQKLKTKHPILPSKPQFPNQFMGKKVVVGPTGGTTTTGGTNKKVVVGVEKKVGMIGRPLFSNPVNPVGGGTTGGTAVKKIQPSIPSSNTTKQFNKK